MALRPIQLDSTTTCISLADPAIDGDASVKGKALPGEAQPLAYLSERTFSPSSWRKTIAIRDGENPTIFTIGVVLPGDLSRLEDECRLGKDDERTRELYWRCFLSGLRGIEHGPTSEPPPTVERGGLAYVDPAWLRTTFVGPLMSVAIEIGQIVFCWQQFQAVDAKNS